MKQKTKDRAGWLAVALLSGATQAQTTYRVAHEFPRFVKSRQDRERVVGDGCVSRRAMALSRTLAELKEPPRRRA